MKGTRHATLYLLDEVGATFLLLNEEDARQAIKDEQKRGLHTVALGRVTVPSEDYYSYAYAVKKNVFSSHMNPVFMQADKGKYEIDWEHLCKQVCVLTGSESECEVLS